MTTVYSTDFEPRSINWELLQRGVEAIKANPENWDQLNWHCGTSHCLAGFIQILLIQDKLKDELPELDASNAFAWQGDAISAHSKLYFDSPHPRYVAARALRLERFEQDWIFGSERTLEDFDRCLARRHIPSR